MTDPVLAALGPQLLFGVDPVVRTRPDDHEITGRMSLPGPAGTAPTGPSPLALTGPDGRFSVGALGVLVDDVLGWSLLASLPPDAWSVSTEIWLDVVAPLPPAGDALLARAATPQPGSYSAGEVTGVDGAVIAYGRERGRRIAQDLGELALDPAPDRVTPAADDVIELLGLKPVTDTTLRMTVAAEHANPRGMLHGGVSFAASEVAATWSRVRAGSTLATTSVHIVHVRGVPAGSEIEFVATTKHAGRGLWVTEVAGVVDGRVGTLTQVSAGPPPT